MALIIPSPSMQQFKIHEKHDHVLQYRTDIGYFECDGCGEFGCNLGYICKPCDFAIHAECSQDFGTYFRSREFKYCNLVLTDKPRARARATLCNVCNHIIDGYLYHCTHANCNINLHPLCADLPRYIKNGEDSVLEFSKKIKYCHYCRDIKRNMVETNNNLGYVTTDGKAQFHVGCAKTLILENLLFGSCLATELRSYEQTHMPSRRSSRFLSKVARIFTKLTKFTCGSF